MYSAKKAGELRQAARIAEPRCRASLADESCARARVSETFPVMTSPMTSLATPRGAFVFQADRQLQHLCWRRRLRPPPLIEIFPFACSEDLQLEGSPALSTPSAPPMSAKVLSADLSAGTGKQGLATQSAHSPSKRHSCGKQRMLEAESRRQQRARGAAAIVTLAVQLRLARAERIV